MGNHLLSSFPRLDSVRLSYSQSYSRKRAKCRKASFFCSKMDFLTLLAISGWQTILDDLAHMYLRVSTKQDRLRPSSCWVMAFSVASKSSKIGHFPPFSAFLPTFPLTNPWSRSHLTPVVVSIDVLFDALSRDAIVSGWISILLRSALFLYPKIDQNGVILCRNDHPFHFNLTCCRQYGPKFRGVDGFGFLVTCYVWLASKSF